MWCFHVSLPFAWPWCQYFVFVVHSLVVTVAGVILSFSIQFVGRSQLKLLLEMRCMTNRCFNACVRNGWFNASLYQTFRKLLHYWQCKFPMFQFHFRKGTWNGMKFENENMVREICSENYIKKCGCRVPFIRFLHCFGDVFVDGPLLGIQQGFANRPGVEICEVVSKFRFWTQIGICDVHQFVAMGIPNPSCHGVWTIGFEDWCCICVRLLTHLFRHFVLVCRSFHLCNEPFCQSPKS